VKKILIIWIVGITLIACYSCERKDIKYRTDWQAGNHTLTLEDGSRSKSFKMGLRPDGVVIWKEVKNAK